VADCGGDLDHLPLCDRQPAHRMRDVDCRIDFREHPSRAPGGRWVGHASRGTSLPLALGAAPGMPADARALALNLTITGAVDDGFASIYPCDSGPTGTSNINYRVGQTVANTVLVGLGAGELCFVSFGRAHVILDLSGVFRGIPSAQALVLSASAAPPDSSVGATQPPAESGVTPVPGVGETPPAPASCAAVPGFEMLAALLWLGVAARRRR
jgi:hypothetical protein